jgi:hypothetical protein
VPLLLLPLLLSEPPKPLFLPFPLPLPLPLTLDFAAVVGVGDRRGNGYLRTQRFLLWWAWRQQLLLQRAPPPEGME